MSKIYTFGLKQTRPKEDRRAALKDFIIANQITVVIDVRYNVGNFYSKWKCRGDAIEAMISLSFGRKVEYVPRSYLGIPSYVRRTYGDDPPKMREWYLANLEQIKALDDLARFRGKRIVLLCVENLDDEKTPYCHRIWLKEYLDHAWNLTS